MDTRQETIERPNPLDPSWGQPTSTADQAVRMIEEARAGFLRQREEALAALDRYRTEAAERIATIEGELAAIDHRSQEFELQISGNHAQPDVEVEVTGLASRPARKAHRRKITASKPGQRRIVNRDAKLAGLPRTFTKEQFYGAGFAQIDLAQLSRAKRITKTAKDGIYKRLAA